jgi:hypothetical protein
MVARLPDWAPRLSALLLERATMPFEWGVNDCLSFAAKVVETTTGHNFYPKYSDYIDEASAAAMLQANGGAVGIISSCLGAGKRNMMAAKRGDIVVVKMPQYTAGVVDDSGQRIALVSPQGLIRLPLKMGWMYWSY